MTYAFTQILALSRKQKIPMRLVECILNVPPYGVRRQSDAATALSLI
jgi:hypothetical protein